MFEDPRRGRQASILQQMFRNSRSQSVIRTDIFRKLTLGAPEKMKNPYAISKDKHKELCNYINLDSTNRENDP